MTLVVGLMSGTSMDGVDAAACEITMKKGLPRISFIASAKANYPDELRRRLMTLESADDVCELNVAVGHVFAKAAQAVMKKLGDRIPDIIGSHGQTIRHMPAKKATLQIGDAAVIAKVTGVDTWFDFRSADMAWGGQGAPLAPVVHLPLFGSDKVDTTAVNIGGIGNITHIPKGARSISELVAYDTGPGNMPIDIAVKTMGRGDYDRDGRIGAGGTVDEKLLKRLLKHPYFGKKYPKSTGRETFGETFMEWADIGEIDADTVATLTELTAVSIVNEIANLAEKGRRTDRIIVCGGGAKNPYLMGRIKRYADKIEVMSSGEIGVPCDMVECGLLALLAYYAEKRISLDLSSITGSRNRATLAGKLAPA